MISKTFLVMGILLATVLIGCATNPDVTPEAVVEARARADQAKAEADQAKAETAAEDEYNVAQSSYDNAKNAESNENISIAFKQYVAAEKEFKLATSKATEIKEAAMSAMREMDTAISGTEQKAEEAIRLAEEGAE